MKEKSSLIESFVLLAYIAIVVAIWFTFVPILLICEWLIFTEYKWYLANGCRTYNADGTWSIRVKSDENNFGCGGCGSAITYWGVKRKIKHRVFEYVLDGTLEHGTPYTIKILWGKQKKEHEIIVTV